MKYKSEMMKVNEVEHYLNAYNFVAESLMITPLYGIQVLVTFILKEEATF